MAWLELAPSGVYKVAFRFADRKVKRSLDTDNPQLAEQTRLRLEDNLRLVEQGRLDVPEGVDLAEFLLYDGKLKPATSVVRDPAPLGAVQASGNGHSLTLQKAMTFDGPAGSARSSAGTGNGDGAPLPLTTAFDNYLAALPENSLAPETRRVARIHMTRLQEILGRETPLGEINKARLQTYVTQREKQKGRRGKPISPVTIKKELGTLSAVWTWAKDNRHLAGTFPGRGLRFSSTAEKPPFQTREQIERQIELGGVTKADEKELWDSLFLTSDEIAEVLAHIGHYKGCDFLYPMAVMAAHTGARRSELCRSRIGDFDLDGSTVLLRERKRVQGKKTTRRVPLSRELRSVIRQWLGQKRKSTFTFPHEWKVERKRKPREHEDAVSVDEASHHLARSLSNSKWATIRGWHVFRHSFCSNCAAAGIDQRMINEWTGHQTEEMVRRYRHLIPSEERAAIGRVFT
jgi:integrase